MLFATGLRQGAKRLLFVLVSVSLLGACSESDDINEASTPSTETTSTAGASASPGPIVFKRAGGEPGIYAVNPDGTNLQAVFEGAAEYPRWSPDGTEISIFCCDNGMAAHFVDVATGELREFPPPDPTLETHCGFAWSPDGETMACESYGVDDPDRNGIYTIRTSDGGDLTRITSNPGGGDIPGDYSPDGTRIVFVRSQDDVPVGIYISNVDGSGLRQLTPPDMILDDSGFGGRWSPDGNRILFVARTAEDHHKAIWTVDADGGVPEQLPITPACGGPNADPNAYGCYSPSWSPDGEQIVFTRSDPSTESIYIVNTDGSGLVQVTDGEDDSPIWGTPTG